MKSKLKIMVLSVNWDTLKARTQFLDGDNVWGRAEATMNALQASWPDWKHVLYFGPPEDGLPCTCEDMAENFYVPGEPRWRPTPTEPHHPDCPRYSLLEDGQLPEP